MGSTSPEGGSPALNTFFGDNFTPEDEATFCADAEAFFRTEEGGRIVQEALDLATGLSPALTCTSSELVAEFMKHLGECAKWYGERWRYYHDKFMATAGVVAQARENRFWAYQLEKWQEQLVINQFPQARISSHLQFSRQQCAVGGVNRRPTRPPKSVGKGY